MKNLDKNSSQQGSSALAFLLFLLVVSLAVWGWVLNIAALVSAPDIAGLEIARALGVFIAPLGALLGWFA